MYKAVKTKECGWMFLSVGFLLSALDIEEYILKPLGINPENSYYFFSLLPNFYYAILFVLAALLIKNHGIKPRGAILLGSIFVLSHLWTFGMVLNMFRGSFTLMALLPSTIYGISLIYLAYVLFKYTTNRKGIEIMFPFGVAGVGILNLTYPITRNSSVAPAMFFIAAIFRFLAAIGAIKATTFIPKAPAGRKQEPKLKPGAYWTNDEKKALEAISNINPIIITRNPNPGIPGIVYWITKVTEGEISENVYAISPTSIDILTDLIVKAFKMGYKVVYIDCLEYLIVENGIKPVLKFLYNVKDIALSNNGSAIIVLNPKALEERKFRIIEKEFEKF
ncbi:DUF835 domain-containing protein [Pyrococcus sp. NA2]|uniref:DUF835 domain-containing protein n=1 Tax=Pyrococcus sp. (strain NA2) TaxID=342949 RepID=UPI001ED97160|nr:DUF835 domain-containing protein [Pyrococcus sp. NA2]